MFLRSFILLRELGYVVEPRGRKPFKSLLNVDQWCARGFAGFEIHTQAWSIPREEGLRYRWGYQRALYRDHTSMELGTNLPR